MNRQIQLFCLSLLTACGLWGCGGGGDGAEPPATPVDTTPPVIAATLVSISMDPPAVSLAPGSASAIAVSGTFSDGTTHTLAASSEVFASSNGAVATVSASGIVNIPVGTAEGATATITAMDTVSGLRTDASDSTLVTVSSMNGAPHSTSVAAATATAQSNPLCTAIQPFYWEIGNATGALGNASATQAGGTPVTASTSTSIASASKWIYGMYVLQKRGGYANLTSDDIKFLNFTSGYTYMGSDTQGQTCTAPVAGADSINYCLTLPSAAAGKTFSSQDPTTIGVFDYDAGHEENHAGKFQPEINALGTTSLGAAIASGLGVPGVSLRYNQPLLAGGIYGNANTYTPLLRAVIGGQLQMLGALGRVQFAHGPVPRLVTRPTARW